MSRGAAALAAALAPASLALALAGLAISVYLTIVHATSPDLLVCGSGGAIDCERVITSAQSTVLGIPVAVLGVAWFTAIAPFCLPRAWRTEDRRVHLLRLVLAIAGIGFVLWLVYAELFVIGALCLWCTGAHVAAFGLFALAVAGYPYS